MLAVLGVYQNGCVKLDNALTVKNPVKVIVTFLEDIEPSTERRFSLSDFSFSESKKLLKGYNGSFSDTLIEERR